MSDRLTCEQQFVRAYLKKCAEHGISVELAQEYAAIIPHMRKEAFGMSDVWRGLGAAGKISYMWPLAILSLMIGGGAAVGGTAGSALAQVTAPSVDPAEVKKRESIAMYKRHQQRIMNKLKARGYGISEIPGPTEDE